MPRFETQAPLDVTVLRSGIPDTVPGRMVNLSERGIAAVMAAELAAGETVGVELQLPMAGDPLRGRALVKYQDKLRCGMEFVGFTAEQQAAIRDWAKAAKLESEKDVTEEDVTEKETKVPEASASETRMSSSKTNPKDEREPQAKSNSEAASEKASSKMADNAAPKASASTEPTPKAASFKEAESNKAGFEKAGFAKAGFTKTKRSGRWGPWATVLILVLFWVVVGLAIFLWRWNRAWAELESGLGNESTATVEKPQAQVSAEVMERLVIHRVEPVYPAEARQSNLQGIIALDIVVGKDGSVVSMHALNGPDVLARAAMDALRWWKFAPYRINGEPATAETTVAVEFKK